MTPFAAVRLVAGRELTTRLRSRTFRILTADWTDKNRHALLSRYLGFPLWDALIFPTIALARLPQFTPIGVSQFSPLTAKALPPPPPTRRRWNRAPSSGAAAKLGGVSLGHFGAFTAQSLRENDYLWGRLDGAELILRLLRQDGSSASADQTTAATAADAIRLASPHSLRDALAAVMNTEKDLRHIDPSVMAHIHRCITAIAPPQL